MAYLNGRRMDMFSANWIGYWISRLFLGISIGRPVVVRWPDEGVYALVEVSSVKFMTFTARFVGGEPDSVDPWAYGQMDNDIEYDRRTLMPVRKPKANQGN